MLAAARVAASQIAIAVCEWHEWLTGAIVGFIPITITIHCEAQKPFTGMALDRGPAHDQHRAPGPWLDGIRPPNSFSTAT